MNSSWRGICQDASQNCSHCMQERCKDRQPFFQNSLKDAPSPIRWKARAEPPKKHAKRGPGRPRKIQRETEFEVIKIDPESDESEGDDYIRGK